MTHAAAEKLTSADADSIDHVRALERSNAELRNLLESTQIATLFLDSDLRVRNFTNAATEIFQLTDRDIGTLLDQIVSRVDYRELVADAREVMATSTPVEREVFDPVSHRHFVARVMPYRSVEDRVGGSVVTLTDLTAVHQALGQSESRYRAFVTASSDAVYRMSPDWNEMRELDGSAFLPDTSTPSSNWMDTYIPPDDHAQVRASIDDAIRHAAMFEFEHRVRRSNGTLGWTHSRAVPILDRDGLISEWIGAASDLTTVRQTELAQLASDERLHSAIEVAQVGTWDWDCATDRIIWSDERFRIVGFVEGADERLGDVSIRRLHPDDVADHHAAVERARDTRGDYVQAFRSLGDDGAIHWLSARGRFIYDDRGTPMWMVGALVDITEARALQQRQEVLVGELQHRTRNMLAVVRSLADKTMRGSASLAEFGVKYQTRLDALARAQGLLSRLSDLERVMFDELITTELSAHGVLDSAAPRVTLNGPKGVRIRSGMVQMLAMALHELATNAIKHGALKGEGGRLDVSWRLITGPGAAPQLEIVWQEHGVSMPPMDEITARSGQGRELIEQALPYQLDATTCYELGTDGLLCVITIPILKVTS